MMFNENFANFAGVLIIFLGIAVLFILMCITWWWAIEVIVRRFKLTKEFVAFIRHRSRRHNKVVK